MTVVMGLSEEHGLLRDTLSRFAAQESDFETRAKRLHASPPDRTALWAPLAELGALGVLLPESAGGFGGGTADLGVVQEALAEGLLAEPVLASGVIAGRILAAASEAEVIEGLIGGARIPVLAHQESFDAFAPPATTASAAGDGYRLDGFKPAVRHGDVASDFVVSATLDGQAALFLVAADAPGLTLAPTRIIDGAGAADLTLAGAPARRLNLDDALATVTDALEWGLAGLAVETAALIATINRHTVDYLNMREQFGTKLASFQALQHRLADMAIDGEEAAAMANLALAALAEAPSPARSATILKASLACDAAGRHAGQDGVQLFGGMGVSDETPISHFLRRMAGIRSQIGTVDARADRLAGLGDWGDNDGPGDAFRAEVREFVQANLPADIAAKVRHGRELDKADFVRWQKILHEKGWFLAGWRKEWGGGGWDAAKHLAFLQEAALAGMPPLIPYGLNMVGPVINKFGSEDQKARWIPGIASSDTWWCQGYSEPGAGSDLAGLKTTAVREGDFYRVNGSKMWTTEAHWADMMHCLVRTDGSGRKQDGITFLLIDMKTPGLTVRPVVTIDGQHHTNQTFFDDVMVPVENRVGEEGAGWAIAKFLLAHERVSIADTGPKLRFFEKIGRMHAAVIADARLSDGLKARLTAKLTDVGVRLETLRAMESYFIEGWANGRPVGADASMLKIRGTEVLQAMTELALDLEGPYAQIHDPHDLHAPVDGPDSARTEASMMAHQYLYGRCWSIFGGSNEIQRNIIAKVKLG